jgi:predicted nucleic acid-binding Zn ribbon protein
LTNIGKYAYNRRSPIGLARNRRLVMATMEDLDYSPCEQCGDGMSETLNQNGKVLCEKCHNKINCGCETCVCEEGN